jgi:hypothetical protein
MSYDPRCRELAEVFLADQPEDAQNEENLDALAQAIQDAIEAYLTDLEVARGRTW